MQHPYEVLAPEYARWIDAARVRPEKAREVDQVARRLLDAPHLAAYGATFDGTGVPVLWHAAVAEREMGGRLDRFLGNGEVLTRVTRLVPKGMGPWASYQSGAIAALRHEGTDRVRAWTLERALYEDEGWNGFGYRGKPRPIPSPYLVAGLTMQQPGKYTSDGRYDPAHMDEQIGTLAIMLRLVELNPALTLPRAAIFVAAPSIVPVLPAVAPAPVGLGGEHDAHFVQDALNRLGRDPPLAVDGSYGRRTRAAVASFQRRHNLEADGLAGPITIAALEAELAARKEPTK